MRTARVWQRLLGLRGTVIEAIRLEVSSIPRSSLEPLGRLLGGFKWSSQHLDSEELRCGNADMAVGSGIGLDAVACLAARWRGVRIGSGLRSDRSRAVE